jgi:hypothetical protein
VSVMSRFTILSGRALSLRNLFQSVREPWGSCQ